MTLFRTQITNTRSMLFDKASAGYFAVANQVVYQMSTKIMFPMYMKRVRPRSFEEPVTTLFGS